MPVGMSVYSLRGNGRSQRLSHALAQGGLAMGYRVTQRCEGEYTKPIDDIAAFYGYQKNLPQIMRDYVGSGRKVVFLDLGYWGRREGGRFMGFHKVSVNERHPTAYFMRRQHSSDRITRHGIRTMDWKPGRHILLAGMSAKSAESYGLQPEEWERWAAAEIRKYTDRPIIYRPKPSWKDATAIAETVMDRAGPLERALDGCHAVVTHHSNVAIDALVAGVPAFCWDGVATPLCSQDLSKIETPFKPRNRGPWLSALGYCQWNFSEIAGGQTFRHLKAEGLLP
jgi:hypothetical protein